MYFRIDIYSYFLLSNIHVIRKMPAGRREVSVHSRLAALFLPPKWPNYQLDGTHLVCISYKTGGGKVRKRRRIWPWGDGKYVFLVLVYRERPSSDPTCSESETLRDEPMRMSCPQVLNKVCACFWAGPLCNTSLRRTKDARFAETTL